MSHPCPCVRNSLLLPSSHNSRHPVCLTTAESLPATAALSSTVSSKPQHNNRASEQAGEVEGGRGSDREVNQSLKITVVERCEAEYNVNNNTQQQRKGRGKGQEMRRENYL